MTAQTSNDEQTDTADASHPGLSPFGWRLFTAVWLLFPISFVMDTFRSLASPYQAVAFAVSISVFVALFVWLMLRNPFPDADATFPELRGRIGLLLVLAALATYVELAFASGTPYRLMYVVVAAAATLPTIPAAWAVGAVAIVVGTISASRSAANGLGAGWQEVIPFVLIGVGMIAVCRLVVTIRELQTAREEIVQLALAEAVAEERLRFARDLHDLLGHSISSITLKSELAERLLPDAPATLRVAAEVRDIQSIARTALREVREAVAGYRRLTLGEELIGAKEMLESVGIACRIENNVGTLPESVETMLTWTVREGTTNVIRHSRARRCDIRITRDDRVVQVEVSDDGRGLRRAQGESDDLSGGSGLSGLSERIAGFVGASVESGPRTEGGFLVRVKLPLRYDVLHEVGR